LPSDEAHAFAMTAVAGQDYFADAPVMLVMAARFARSMWKYRDHPKIYRAILLEMGHISQNLYLTATEMNLGAFITAAINEIEIEQAFGLESMSEGPLCVCGFGARAKERVTVEFDPAHRVWPVK
jgi:SagB-type dehydrogenase family enzyme